MPTVNNRYLDIQSVAVELVAHLEPVVSRDFANAKGGVEGTQSRTNAETFRTAIGGVGPRHPFLRPLNGVTANAEGVSGYAAFF